MRTPIISFYYVNDPPIETFIKESKLQILRRILLGKKRPTQTHYSRSKIQHKFDDIEHALKVLIPMSYKGKGLPRTFIVSLNNLNGNKKENFFYIHKGKYTISMNFVAKNAEEVYNITKQLNEIIPNEVDITCPGHNKKFRIKINVINIQKESFRGKLEEEIRLEEVYRRELNEMKK